MELAMLQWFEKEAPIRTKFRVLTLAQSGFGAVAALGTVLAVFGEVNGGICVAITLVAVMGIVITSMISGRAISGPYVSTVERVEALAGGDLASPIRFTDYGDCVGRLRARTTFRDQAQESHTMRAELQRVVETLSGALQQLATNRLDCTIDQAFPATYEALRKDFNAAAFGLADAISGVRASARRVLDGANEIRTASDDLSNRNEQQAATLEETTAAMNQVTEGVKESARGAGRGAEIHHRGASGSRRGRRGGDPRSRPCRPSNAAQEISQIIGVIDGIAFQTNLLALNAGVKPRAGDAGKGFAVVATEVRALAQRSADAAKDIKALITTSSEQVSGGVTLVRETGDLLGKIVNRVGDITTLMARSPPMPACRPAACKWSTTPCRNGPRDPAERRHGGTIHRRRAQPGRRGARAEHHRGPLQHRWAQRGLRRCGALRAPQPPACPHRRARPAPRRRQRPPLRLTNPHRPRPPAAPWRCNPSPPRTGRNSDLLS
jgi:methyl-accepting chemotaxis protein